MLVEINFQNDAHAAATLDRALSKFLSLVDHVARFHPEAVPDYFPRSVFRGLCRAIPDQVSASMEGPSS